MGAHQFQTEVTQLLELIIHSLYSHREIFLRELVSNASDAIDKLKYLTVSDEKFKALAFEPRIGIAFDREAKTITLTDNGIGMNEAELTENLGTIARSGTRQFLSQLGDDARKASNLIGRFGVGFYSSFMVATAVEVTTRRAGDDAAWLWKSDGKGSYDIESAQRDGHGTTVVLRLNDDGLEYANRWRLQELVKKYSNHIAVPIFLSYVEEDHETKEKKPKEEQVNSAAALWTRPKSELSETDYADFYKNFADTDEEPLLHIHTHAEGTIEYNTLFYVPSKASFDLYHADYKPGVKLYVRRVFITDDEKELLPPYLRFVRGVIDSEDLPLNVSREILQQNRVMTNIRTASVKKILGELKELAERDKAKYDAFATEFNRPIKEGIYSDFANKETLLDLVRFKSTAVDGWTSLADYKSRLKDGQKAIYYLVGDSEERLRKSPLLERYKREGIEVLLCSDEVDELVIPMIGRYSDLELKAANRTGADADFSNTKDETKEQELKPVLERLKKALGDRVKEVRVSNRLTESPACVVMDENDPSLQFQQLMKSLGREAAAEIKPILEVNAEHHLIKRLSGTDDERITEDTAFVLLGQALLVEGAPLPDPADFVARTNRLLVG